jgi:hypothetical protein
MFRLFLKKKLIAGDEKNKAQAAAQIRANAQSTVGSNRRVLSRYNVDHKHLTLMNDQDILLVREISAKGFSTDVSARGFERLCIGDIYEARVRYHRETYDLKARVAWKAEGVVGFELVESPKETLSFIKRLLKPIEIAQSMQLVKPNFLRDNVENKSWFHGDDDSDLYIWREGESSQIKAWQLAIGNSYITWDDNTGIQTGSITQDPAPEKILGHPMSPLQKPDSAIDTKKRQLAIDVIMALHDPVKDLILETLGE